VQLSEPTPEGIRMSGYLPKELVGLFARYRLKSWKIITKNPTQIAWILLLLEKKTLFFRDDKDFSTLIIATIGADMMRQAGLATIGAGHAIAGFKGIMYTPAIAAP